MSHIPEGATYYYKSTYFKVSDTTYTHYYSKMWKESASITNQEVIDNGVKIHDVQTSSTTN